MSQHHFMTIPLPQMLRLFLLTPYDKTLTVAVGATSSTITRNLRFSTAECKSCSRTLEVYIATFWLRLSRGLHNMLMDHSYLQHKRACCVIWLKPEGPFNGMFNLLQSCLLFYALLNNGKHLIMGWWSISRFSLYWLQDQGRGPKQCVSCLW